MRRIFKAPALGIGTRLTIGFGILVGLTLLVVAIALLAGRAATHDIEATEAVSAPASLASAKAQEALLRMQLHLRGYLVLSDAEDIGQYDEARNAFEKALASLQGLTTAWEQDELQRVRALTDGYDSWKRLPPTLFKLHEDALRNRPALRLSRIDVQAQRVRVLAETEAMVELQKMRPSEAMSRETLTAILTFQSSFDALATNVMALGASGESSFKLTYSSQLIANAALWDELNAMRGSLTRPQREHFDRIAEARAELTSLALRVRTILDGDRAYEDLFLYRTQVVPQATALLDLLQQITARQQAQLQRDLARARQGLARSRAQTVAGGALALALGVAMAFLLRRSIVGPVQRLTRVAGQVTGGDLKAQARLEARDEIGMLAESFNTMTARLAETIANLEQAYAQAQQATNAAETANRAKSGFLANMSHELRTPLNAILGYAQILRSADGMSVRQVAGLDTIQRSGEHLLLLINDMLDLARIEAGKVELYVDDVDLGSLLRTTTDIVRLEAQRKALQFDFEVIGDVPTMVRADERRLRQVLLNLLNNAVKFTQRGSVALRVTLQSAVAEHARLRFEVEDTGYGIAPEHLERIFLPFEQAADVQRRFGGTGLGLAISRQLLALSGSDIHVDSRPGIGSRFWFELELQLVTRSRSAQASAKGTETAGITGYQGPRRKVLVVDDIATNRMPVVQYLGRLGFDMLEAEDGAAALRCVQSDWPDLVLMDTAMPVMDGSEAIRQLRRIDRFHDLPVIVVSANASSADEHGSLAAGANAFLPKPVEFGRLLHEIAMLLGLTWTRQGEAQIPAPADAALTLVAPPPDELSALLHLARIGNMRSLRAHADHLAVLDDNLRPLATRLCRLADEFESTGIVDLLIALQQRGPNEGGGSDATKR